MKLLPKPVTMIAITGLSAAFVLSGCTSNDTSNTASSQESAAAATAADDAAAADDGGAVSVNARPDECGLQELQGPVVSFGPFDGSIKFFQPGEMAPNPSAAVQMRSYADSQMHLEFDLKANEFGTNWGYAMDETPANLPIAFELADSEGREVVTGMMTAMNAIDGSHYGTNLPKDTITAPGEYTLKLTVHPPQDYDLHKDYITGVPAEEWFGPLTAEMPWEITQENLDFVEQNTVSDPMTAPENCRDYPVTMYEDSTAEQAMDAAEGLSPVPIPE